VTTWRYDSLSSDAVYVVTLADNGLLGCECKGWLLAGRGRSHWCSHTRDVVERHGLIVEERGGYVFAATPDVELTSSSIATIIKGVGAMRPEEAVTVATAVTTAGELDAMKASAMVEGKFGHLFDVEGFMVPAKFDAAFGTGEWTMDEKLDGHRCLVTKADGVVSTTLRSIPSLPSQILADLAAMPDGVYDGELLVPGGISTDVPNLSLRDELVFAMFDLVEVMGQSVIHLPLVDRRALLLMAGQHVPGNAVCVVAQQAPSWDGVKAIWANGGEGVILKKLSSKYRPGHRSADWLKVKRLEQHTVTVTGFEAGSFGPTAVVLVRFDDGTKGRCKNRNSELLAATVANPDAYIGRRLVVECQQRVRGSNKPRHPMMKKFETDHLAGEAEE
jgi:hypothetical protein